MEIPRVEEEICYDEFYREYILANKPCILSSKFTSRWFAPKLWVKNDRIDFEYLVANYGQTEVPVADCKGQYYDSHPKTTYTLQDYLKYMQNYKEMEYSKDLPCLYLKDWHFFKSYHKHNVYEVPTYFRSDWLNEYYLDKESDDDYRFVYIGPKGSWTPFHADVFRSFSWSANIWGKKKWLLVPPGQESPNKNKLVYDITLDATDKYWIEVIQEAGEIIFVPSNWHHQVHNLEDTISINHNWFNAANLGSITAALGSAHEEVLAELGELVQSGDEESLHQTELVLRCHHGLNWHDYANLLYYISTKRTNTPSGPEVHALCSICNKNPGSLCDPKSHTAFDVSAIKAELLNFPLLDSTLSQLKDLLENN